MSFIGIPIKFETSKLFKGLDIPGEKTDLTDLHITLLIFEDGLSINELGPAIETAYDVIAETNPFSIKLDSISCFPKREDNPCPIIIPIKSKELQELCENLKKAFDKKDINYSKTFKEYKPHITLSYAEKEIKEFKIDPIELVINELVLFGGDSGCYSDVFVTYPLKKINKLNFVQKCHLKYGAKDLFKQWESFVKETPSKIIFKPFYEEFTKNFHLELLTKEEYNDLFMYTQKAYDTWQVLKTESYLPLQRENFYVRFHKTMANVNYILNLLIALYEEKLAEDAKTDWRPLETIPEDHYASYNKLNFIRKCHLKYGTLSLYDQWRTFIREAPSNIIFEDFYDDFTKNFHLDLLSREGKNYLLINSQRAYDIWQVLKNKNLSFSQKDNLYSKFNAAMENIHYTLNMLMTLYKEKLVEDTQTDWHPSETLPEDYYT